MLTPPGAPGPLLMSVEGPVGIPGESVSARTEPSGELGTGRPASARSDFGLTSGRRTSGETSGLTSGETSGLTSGETSGLTSGETSGVTSGVTSG